MAAELLSDLSRATDSNSSPLSGALWYFYATGTLTPQSVYTTAALDVAHANPVVADSGGLFAPIYFDASLTYRGILKTAAGATLRDIDPINTGLLSALVSITGAYPTGATGNGAADDTAEVQTALSSGAKIVTLLQGKTYRTTSTLTVPAGVFIDATGSTLLADHNGKALTFTDGGGIRGGKITGPGGAAYIAGSTGIYCAGTSNSPAAPTYVAPPDIVGTEIEEFGEYGVYLKYCKKGRLDRPYIHDCAYAGVGVASCEDLTVNAPRVYDIGPGSPADAYGMFFDRAEAGASETSDPRTYRVTVIAPDVQRVEAAGGNGEGIDSHGGVDIQVIGGSIIDCQKGLVFTRSTIAGVAALAPIRCKATGTSIRGVHEGMGVSISGAITGSSTIVQYAEDCEINGVTIDGHGVDNTSGVGGLLLQATKNTKVTGCTLRENARNGIYINFGNIGLNISGCTFLDPHDTTYTAPACIQVAGNDNTGYVGNNTFRYETAALATYVAVNSIRVEAALTGLDLDFGASTFQGLDATHLNCTFGTTSGARYYGMARQSGTSAIVGSSGNSQDAVDLVFPKRFPYVPRVTVAQHFVNGAQQRNIMMVDEVSTPVTAAQARIWVRTISGTFPATESNGFTWVAE